MLKKWLALFFTVLFMLAACQSPVYNQAESNIANVKLKEAAARRKSDMDAKALPPLVVNKGLYVDTSPISLEKSPSWLKSYMVIRGDQLPFAYYSRTISQGAGSRVLTRYQIGLDSTLNVSLNYSGTVQGALDLLASKTGYAYSIHGNSIYWQAFITRTFDIAFMPGSTDYFMGKGGGGSGTANTSVGGAMGGSVSNYVSSDASDSEFSNLKGTLSIWKDLHGTIKKLLSPDGKLMVSESTTSVTVRDRPANVNLVGEYIKNLNKSLTKQVLVKIEILEVDLSNAWNFGIDWQIVANAFHNSAFVLNGNFGTPITISKVFSGQSAVSSIGLPAPLYPQLGVAQHVASGKNPIPSYTILFNALSQQGKTSVVSQPRVVCLNNQVCVIRIVQQNGYAASVQNTSLASSSSVSVGVGTVTSQITPGVVITGLTLYILPKILKDKVVMQINADLSSNLGFTPFGPAGTTNPNEATVQLPNISEKHFNQRSVIESGDTLILAGFRQMNNQANANQFLRFQSLGGKGAQETNSETIVLITPIIL